MNAQTLLLDSLNTRWDKYKAELKTCRAEFSEEAVHDFRVSARRLLASLDLLRAVIQDPRIQKIRRILKSQLDSLDDLRDTQVLLADISETIHETPVLKPFQEHILLKEKKILRKARKEIKSIKIASLSRRIEKLNLKIEEIKLANLDINLFSAVDEAYALVNHRYILVNPDQTITIHRLRIAFKKFRYMVEVIFPILESFPINYLKRMHDYQAVMGDIQDTEVALQELADFGEIKPTSYDLEPASLYYREHYSLALARFFEDKGEVITFWRAAPDQSFFKEI